MKWFKHDSNASIDAKLKRVRLKYGMEGYGLYWYCLELIAQTVEIHNLSFELEHDAELIAMDTGINQERVQDMMNDLVKWGLFENQQGIITCLKMASRTDEYTNKLLRTKSPLPPDKIPPNRIDKNRTEQTDKKNKRTVFVKPSFDDVHIYCNERNNTVNPQAFIDHYESNGWKVGKNKMKSWKACVRTWENRDKEKANGKNRPTSAASRVHNKLKNMYLAADDAEILT